MQQSIDIHAVKNVETEIHKHTREDGSEFFVRRINVKTGDGSEVMVSLYCDTLVTVEER